MNAKKATAKTPRNQPRDDFFSILQEMDAGDNRTAAIVAAAFVENNLALAIMARFRDMSGDEQRHIFEDRGMLSDFAAKTDIGFVLNIYDALVRDDLDKIRNIRNRFAHHLDVRDFDHPEVAGRCDSLNSRKYLDSLARPKQPTSPTRKQVFLDTAAHLGARFDLESRQAKRPQPGTARVVPEY